ncbi:MAG: hypothetical protein BJBARM5_0627 [Candidatus Parvarchaeum acidophilus ARMAN-5]|uniref:Uncharacterized protein n=1 Tax=Candidatus Parvarchaeum acidophilus ARMAN-5 TaxID=662762 RepID=D6GVV8_PARA5|nr:MAG: hypothetical protein BJBARM5_0627 [Candidatus Parvarchaeum acidophilus ARMAN-5]
MFGKKKRIEDILFKETTTEKKGEINITRYLANNDMTAVEYTLPEMGKIQNKVRVTMIKPQRFVTYLSTNMRFDPYNDRPQRF